MRLADGRWRASGPEKFTFTEPDEDLAVLRFRQWQGAARGNSLRIGVDTMGLDVPSAMEKAIAIDVEVKFKPGQAPEFARLLEEGAFWAAIRRELLTRPKYCAEQTGIEQLAYLADLRPPETLPTFKELEQLWTDHATAKPEEQRKVLADWRYFVEHSGVGGLKDITPATVIAYRQKVYRLGLGGKRQQHLFNRARRMLTFAQGQAVAMKACADALQAMRLLTPNGTAASIDPHPIERGDFAALMGKAEGDDRAMLLLMLNAALHLQEAIDLRWEDIQGNTLIAHRKKKGRFLRIAMLWPETMSALASVRRRGDHIFNGVNGAQLTVSGAGKRFRRLRQAAGVSHVVSDQIRDGAATAVGAANVNDQIFNLLMGLRNPGVKDNYAKRNPAMVQPATDAVYAVYFR